MAATHIHGSTKYVYYKQYLTLTYFDVIKEIKCFRFLYIFSRYILNVDFEMHLSTPPPPGDLGCCRSKAVILLLLTFCLLLLPLWESEIVLVFCALIYVHSSIAIILLGKRELLALLNLSSWWRVMFERLFLAVPCC